MSVPINLIMVFLWLLGGLSLFLYGIDMMSKALRRGAGIAFRKKLNAFTCTPLKGLLTGAVITGFIQSSSATTVMIVGFINAGLLTFTKSIGVILGANLGTTVTPMITALNLDEMALPFLGVGFTISFFAQKRAKREFGMALMGFGLLFFGLMLMKFAVSGHSEAIHSWLQIRGDGGLRGWIITFLMAMIATAIIQSSSATVVMIQALAFQGAIPHFGIAIPMILGAKVGTCITAILATLNSGYAAKRAAFAHLLFNVAGVLITVLLSGFYLWIIPKTSANLANQVAYGHMMITFINVMLFLPIAQKFGEYVHNLYSGEDKFNATCQYLVPEELDNPTLVLKNIAKETRRLCVLCTGMVWDAVNSLLDQNEALQDEIIEREDLVDNLYYTIADYVHEVARKELPLELKGRPAQLFHIMNNVERIGDHAENIVELAQAYRGTGRGFSDEAIAEIKELMDMVLQMSQHLHAHMDTPSVEQREKILSVRKAFKHRRFEILDNNERRLASGACLPFEGIIFVDLIDNLLSIVNHVGRIARSMRVYKKS